MLDTDVLDSPHIRKKSKPWKNRNLLHTKEGLFNFKNLCTGSILLKYSTWNLSKNREDLYNVHNVKITVEVAYNVHEVGSTITSIFLHTIMLDVCAV